MAEVNEQAAVEHFLSSLPSSLAELAPKFTSWAHLLHASSRQLKALGLTVKQRKSLLYHTELYKARQRRREMLHYLAQPANREQSAVAVQQALYDLAYSHVYARQWKRAEEREAEQWWRKATEMNRLRKTFIRNQWSVNTAHMHTCTRTCDTSPLYRLLSGSFLLSVCLSVCSLSQERGAGADQPGVHEAAAQP